MPTSSGPSLGGDRRNLLLLALGGVLALAAVGAAIALAVGGGDGGGDGGDASGVRAALEAAGCTLQSVPAVKGDHSIVVPGDRTDKWNTDPPTSGPHYGLTVVWGIYAEPVNQAQLVHNLEHGGVAVQYGSEVDTETVAQVRTFVEGKPRGTVLAPYPPLGDKISLGNWYIENPSDPGNGTGYLAKCDAFDEDAFEAFFDAFQFKGPERFPPDTLLPGNQ